MNEYIITMKDGSYLGINADYFEFTNYALIFRLNEKTICYIPNGYFDYIQQMINDRLGQKIYR